MEENKVATDSSTPNSPDLTRLSGEQAEERTAREGREYSYKHWTASGPLDYNAHNVKGFIEVAAPNDACFTALFPLRKDAEDYIAWKESGSECSRLASRVEELEAALKICRYFIRREHFQDGSPDSHLSGEAEQIATDALAGAHAEEKE